MSKFDKVFDKTDKKIENNGTIDFKKSSVNKSGRATDELEYKKKRIQTYIKESDFERLVKILQPLEKPAERVRKLIIAEIERCEKQKKKS